MSDKTTLYVKKRKTVTVPGKGSQFRALLQGMYDAVLLTDLKGRIEDFNDRAIRFFQYRREEMENLAIGDLIQGMTDDLFAQIREQLQEGRFFVLQTSGLCRDESRFPAEIALSRLKLEGEARLIFSVRNISRRREMELQLRTERNALQNAASAIVITDPEGRISLINPAFRHLWRLEESDRPEGLSISEFLAESDAAAACIGKPSEGGEWIGELTIRDRRGRNLHVQASSAPNRDEKGDPIGMVFSFIDITGLKKAKEAIRREVESQMSRAGEEDDFTGMLNIITVPDVLQLADATQKSGVLRLTDRDNEIVGEVKMRNGQIVRAQCGDAAGEEAVYRLLQSETAAAFHFHQEEVADPDEIGKSTMGLLMEGARVMDEKQPDGKS